MSRYRNPIAVGSWVRLKNNCTEHPSTKHNEHPPREFIGIYLANGEVDWMTPELPMKHYHWNPDCLELVLAPEAPDVPV